MKKIIIPLIIALLCFSAAGCGSGQTAPAESSAPAEPEAGGGTAPVSAAVSGEYDLMETEYTDRDLDGSWDESQAVTIQLNGSMMEITGQGATASGAVVTIQSAGTYVLSGSFQGQIIVAAGKEDSVQLVLNGVTLECDHQAPLWIQSADQVYLTLAENTENAVKDGESYTLEAGEDEPNGAIFSKEAVTINGSGSLTVTAQYQDGIVSKDDLKVCGGTITIEAAGDGIRGKDSVSICGGELTITAGADCIKSTNDQDTEKGWVSIEGGQFVLTAGNDAVQAETTLQWIDGRITAVCGGGSANAPAHQSQDWGPGGFGGAASASAEDTESMKGLKAGSRLVILGGTAELDCADDTVHCNGDVIIAGGTLNLTSGDDGVHADAALQIEGGAITIEESYEGLEGQTVTIQGGEIQLTASDDGVNAAGGSDSQGFRLQDSFAGGADRYIMITGGALVVSADGDGLDSNGNLFIEGGEIWIHGPTSGDDGAMDCDGTLEITGGAIAAVGSSGMAQGFSDSSSQASLMITFSSVQAAGTEISLQNERGETVLAFTPEKEYQNIVLSCPQLEQGQTYRVISGGEERCQVTLEGSVTSIDDSGAAVSVNAGMGGMGMPGGQGPGSMSRNGGMGGQGLTPPGQQ